MNHLKILQRAAVVVLVMLVGFSSKLSAQTCPTSNEITITVIPEATITTAGATTVCIGGDATLTATPGGGTGTCGIQWQSSTDGVTWADVAGATSTTLNLTGLTATTSYHAVYTCSGSGCDAITSNSQTVTVNPDLSITANLSNITQCVGGSDQLSITVTGGSGGPLVYTWEQSTDNSTWGAAAGAGNASTYTPSSAVASTMYYRVTASDAVSGCQSILSATSTVTIAPDLSILANLSNITECIGGNATLTISTTGGTGGTLTYTWEESTNNSTWGPAAGATSSTTYTPASATAGTMYYRVRVSDAATGCDAITSATSTVTITPDLTITANLNNITECVGGGDPLVVTTGGGTGGSLSYTWEQSTDNSSWGAAAGSGNSATYVPSSAVAGTMYYRVRISDASSGCDAITSANATVIVTPDLTITANLANITECVGGGNQLTVTTTGGTGGALTYTWEQSTDNSTWGAAASASNSATYTPSSTIAGTMYYRVRISDGATGCDAITAATSTVTVTPDLSILADLSNITQCVGGGDQLTISTTGGTGGALTYTWEQSSDNSTWGAAAGAGNSATYTPSSASAGTMYYRVRVSDAATGCDAITSATSTVTIAPDLTISANLANITECIGGGDQLKVTTTGGTGGALTYTWEQSSDNSTWGAAAGAGNSDTYTPSSAAAGTMYYRVRISDGATGCDAITAATSTVTITPDLTITADLADITECVGGNRTLTVATTGGTGGALTYTWEQSTDGGSTWGAAASASNAPTYTPSSVTASAVKYRVRVSDAATGCDAITSAISTVNVTPDLTISTDLSDITECVGGTLTLTVATTGGSGGALTYTWEQSGDNSTWGAAASASNSATYTPSSVTAGIMYYRVSVSDAATGCDAVVSAVSTVTINPDISVSTAPADITECVSGNVPLTVTASGGVGTLTYQWEESTDGTSYTDVSGETAATYIPPSATAGVKYYRVRIANTGNGCQTVTSTSATVTVVAKPTIAIAASVNTVCIGGGSVLTATPLNGTGTCTIQWISSTDAGATWNDIPGATGTTYTTPALNANTNYKARYTCSGNGCCN